MTIVDRATQVFASHMGLKHTPMCTWDAENGGGYYQVSRNVLGDFVVVCRFGGQLAKDDSKSMMIFKYQNTTGTQCSLNYNNHSR